ncbi:hypothetical protein Pcinc_025878 [Petrolisthes cinctipes]|uniref:Uncharacterized protein n=1 Tax=Petrolisthes cinctipes TaxID=88211 RepID=A0AAE1F8E8_PETCI|nr:hypothetical protein Pcinc_025878 [Petrolisthes cinctipes]
MEWCEYEYGVDWNGVGRSMEWSGVGRSMEWSGVGRSLEWSGVGRSMEWSGVGDNNKCNTPLGLKDGTIPDASFTSSVPDSNPHQARLDGSGAWCVTVDLSAPSPPTLTVDLGSTRLISGMITQGPPPDLHDESYSVQYLVFLGNSTQDTPEEWGPCCPEKNEVRQETEFAMTDDENEGEKQTTHPFDSLVLARHVQLKLRTDIRSFGHPIKCLRLELLGCPVDVEPVTGMGITAEPSGFLSVSWSQAVVEIPMDDDGSSQLNLTDSAYKLQVERTGGGEEDEVQEYTINALRHMIAQPIYGAKYSASLTCVHQGEDLKCGSASVDAKPAACTSNPCPQNEKGEGPRQGEARVVGTDKVELKWDYDPSGWITRDLDVELNDKDDTLVTKTTITREDTSVEMTGVAADQSYKVKFFPKLESERLAEFTFDLHTISWENMELAPENGGYGAFLADVGLAADVLWNGTLKLTWRPANVLGPLAQNDTQDSPSSPTERSVAEEGSEASGYPAYLYKVEVTYDNEKWSANVSVEVDEESSGSDATLLRVDMPLLRFQTMYQVRLSCNFGQMFSQCGEASAFTAMPLQFAKMGGKTIVLTMTENRAGWEQQSTQCGRGHGFLASPATNEKTNLLAGALTDNFTDTSPQPSHWLGLIMCPHATGSPWSDGSKWDFKRVILENSQLSSVSCCIKFNWEGVQYQWLGEVCDALLPAVCEYKPEGGFHVVEGLVGEVRELQRNNSNVTEAGVTWDYVEDFWTPSGLVVSFCHTRNLRDLLTDPGKPSQKCKVTKLGVEARSHNQTDLDPFSEYQVNVSATIRPVEFDGPPATNLIRTFPKEPMWAEVDSSGFVNFMWDYKVSEFGEDDFVNVQLLQTSGTPPTTTEVTSTTMKAVGGQLKGLKLGANYTLKLTEPKGKKRTEAVSFLAYPPCECEDCQVGGLCFQTTQTPGTPAMSSGNCKSNEAGLAVITSPQEVAMVLTMAEDLGDDLWVSHTSSKVKAPDQPNTAPLNDDPNAEVLDNDNTTPDPTTTTTPTTVPPPTVCLMVSRAERMVVEEQCTNAHRAACTSKAPVGEAFPNLKATPGSNDISFSWDSSKFGWDAKFEVIYQKKAEKLYKRALQFMPITQSPAVVGQLQAETDYTFDFVADLEPGFLSTSQQIEASTGKQTAASTSEQLVLGSTSVSQFDLILLVCCSLLVAACITTMLLFFATGMFYQDCVAQLGFLFSLLVAYLILLVGHPPLVDSDNETGCIIVAVLLHLLFLCAFTFLMLEALTIAHLLVIHIKSPFQNSNWMLVGFGLGVPLVIVGVTAGFLYDRYPDFTRNNCWLNPLDTSVWAQAVPMGLAFIATLVLLFITLCNKAPSPELVEIYFRGRQSDCNKLRWVVLALTVELAVAWSAGVSAYQLNSQTAYIIFSVATLILAITIAGARTTFDDTFRSKMHRLCCGTELTYKRSEILSISGRSRVSPSGGGSAASARVIAPVGSKPREMVYSARHRHGSITPSTCSSQTRCNTPLETTRSDSAMGRASSSLGRAASSLGMSTSSPGNSIYTVKSIAAVNYKPTQSNKVSPTASPPGDLRKETGSTTSPATTTKSMCSDNRNSPTHSTTSSTSLQQRQARSPSNASYRSALNSDRAGSEDELIPPKSA